jgi:type I restriction enzyme S subunit
MMERLSISELARKGWLYFSDGYRTKKPELGPTGYPIMRVAQVLDGYVGPASDPEYVREEFKKKIGLKSSVNGDVILTTKGTVGRMAKIGAKDEGYVYSPQVCFFRILDNSRIDKDYLFYTMAAEDFRRQMLSVSTQTDMAPYINLKDLGSLEMDLPHLSEQRSIAQVLGALDDKIELNRRMNATLEAIAQAVFKEWFVDGAKEEWKEMPLSALGPIMMGNSPKGDSYNETGEGTPLINGPVEYGEYFPLKRKWTTEPTRFAEAGDLIFCVRGSTTGRCVVADDRFAIGRGVCAMRSKHRVFLYETVAVRMQDILAKTTGSVFPSLSSDDIKSFPITLPPEEVRNQFEQQAGPLIERVEANHRENLTLAALRDTLLPKLMRGEVRVKAMQRAVDASR